MKKTLIILEPYQYWGGHNIRNADLLKNIEPYKKNFFSNIRFACEIKKIFKRGSYLRHLNYNAKVKSREIDFKRLIEETKNTAILLSSFGPWDIEAFFNVLMNNNYLKKYHKSQNIIWFHGALKWFTPLYKFYNTGEKEKSFTELIKKRKVIFTLFSEFEQIVLEKVFTSWDFSYITFPVYKLKEKVFTSKLPKRSVNCSYIGLFRTEKNPLIMEKIIKLLSEKKRNIKFFYQIHPLTLDNVILYSRLYKMKNTEIIIKALNGKEYEQILINTDIGFLPYNKFTYSVKGSGIFEEYITNNIPAFVPNETWMSFMLKKHGLFETIYSNYKNDLEEKFEFVVNNYDMILEKWFYHLERERKDRDVSEFLKKIYFILLVNENHKENEYNFSNEFNRIIDRGIVDFLLEALIFYKNNPQMFESLFLILNNQNKNNIIKNPKYKNVLKILENNHTKKYTKKAFIVSEEENLKHLSIMSLFRKDKRKLRKILENKDFLAAIKSIEHISQINLIPARIYLLYWRLFPSEKLKKIYYIKRSIQIFLSNFKNKSKLNKWHSEFFVEIYSEFVNFLLENNIKKEKNFIRDCRETIYFSKKLNQKYYLLALCEFYLQNFNKAFILLKKAFFYCNFTRDILIKIYNIGSYFKSKGCYEKAKEPYSFIIHRKKIPLLKAGAYFHLGEIALHEGKKDEAKKYVKKCLKLNPEHKRAREYLERM